MDNNPLLTTFSGHILGSLHCLYNNIQSSWWMADILHVGNLLLWQDVRSDLAVPSNPHWNVVSQTQAHNPEYVSVFDLC